MPDPEEQLDEVEWRVMRFLAPLAQIEPVSPRTASAKPPRKRLALAAGAVMVLGAGVAVASETFTGTPINETTFQGAGGTVSCLVYGLSGEEAAATLAEKGYEAQWRVETFDDQVLGSGGGLGAVTGHTEAVGNPPSGGFVYQAIEGPAKQAFVFVADPSDEGMPRFQEPANCAGE